MLRVAVYKESTMTRLETDLADHVINHAMEEAA
jgi:hypothetical protein